MADNEAKSGDRMAVHYRVIREPIITEKAVTPMGPVERDRKGAKTNERRQQYVFWVERESNKIAIRHAIEAIFEVKVEKVRTAIIKGRTRRVRFRKAARPPMKKAYVTLKEGDAIDFMS